MSGICVAVAGAADAQELSRLHGLCFDDPWDASSFEGLMKMPGSLTLLAATGEARPPEAFLLARAAAGEAEIVTIGVAPAARGRGLAKALVSELRTSLTNCDVIFLEVADDNQAAIGLYEQLGFETVGHRKDYYARGTGKTMSARIMRLSLG